MEKSRDTTAETEGTRSIRLRYSRQFQHGGHSHTIDVETHLALGTSAEIREQVMHELESDVDQLARQITQRGTRPTAGEAQYPQPSTRPNGIPRAPEAPAPPPALPRSAAAAAQPTAPLPVSESMPAAPGGSKNQTITLPQFLNAIKRRLNMSAAEAMDLLNVTELTGLNYREAYNRLAALKEAPGGSGSSSTPERNTPQTPVVEAPRQTNRGTPTAPNTRSSTNPPAPTTRASGASSSRPDSPSASIITQESRPTAPAREQNGEFAGSVKAPIPIHLAEVRDVNPRYAFAEEEEEEDYELPTEEDEEHGYRQAAENKLERLKELRTTGNAASPERLVALTNVIGDQISEEQLGQIVKMITGTTNKKRLKIQQVEELISWAKGDFFAEEVNAILEPFDEEAE